MAPVLDRTGSARLDGGSDKLEKPNESARGRKRLSRRGSRVRVPSTPPAIRGHRTAVPFSFGMPASHGLPGSAVFSVSRIRTLIAAGGSRFLTFKVAEPHRGILAILRVLCSLARPPWRTQQPGSHDPQGRPKSKGAAAPHVLSGGSLSQAKDLALLHPVHGQRRHGHQPPHSHTYRLLAARDGLDDVGRQEGEIHGACDVAPGLTLLSSQ